MCGSRRLVESVNNSSSSPRKCDRCERHLAFAASPSSRLTASRWPADGVLCRPMVPREGTRLGNALQKPTKPVSVRGEPSSERPNCASVRSDLAVRVASQQRQTALESALATPVAGNAAKRHERAIAGDSLKTESSASDAPAATPSSTRSASAQHHPRARETSAPRAYLKRSGPRRRSIGVELRAQYW